MGGPLPRGQRGLSLPDQPPQFATPGEATIKMAAGNLYTTDNPVFASFCFYAALVALKMLMMSFLTAYHRLTKNIFANPEDAAMSKVKVRTDESVERVRRAHLNDMENIVPFLFIGLIYVGTSPAVSSAVFYFRLFAACRMVHTVVYAIVVMPQPSRALAYFGGMFVNLMMIASILSTYSYAM